MLCNVMYQITNILIQRTFVRIFEAITEMMQQFVVRSSNLALQTEATPIQSGRVVFTESILILQDFLEEYDDGHLGWNIPLQLRSEDFGVFTRKFDLH